MSHFIRIALFFLMLWAHLGQARRRSHHHHNVLVNAPKRFNRNFLQEYAKRSVDAFNKQSTDKFKYILLDVIGGRANEENKSLEIMMKFGRTRCQKTEDRYFCQTTPEMHIEEKLFKVGISKKLQSEAVEYKFEETPTDSLANVKKLYRDTIDE